MSLICQFCITVSLLAGISGLFVIGFTHFKTQSASNPENISIANVPAEAIYDTLKAEFTALSMDHQKLSREKSELEARIEELTSENENLRKNLSSSSSKMQKDLLELQEDYLRLDQEKRTLEKNLLDITKSNSELQKKLQDSRNEFIKLSKEKSELEKKITALMLEINSLQAKETDLNEQLRSITGNLENLQAENKKLNAELADFQKTISRYSDLQKEFLALQGKYSELSEVKNNLEYDVNQITLENTSLNAGNLELIQKLNAVTVSFDNLKAENNALKLDNEALKNNIFVFMNDSKVFNGHHYKVFNIITLWPEAKLKCEEMGGHLCTTNSLAEFEFIKTLLDSKNEYWLGASDADREGDWKWITNEQLSMTKWHPSRPYNNNNRNFLVLSHINDSTWYWYDGWNKGTALFICEWDF